MKVPSLMIMLVATLALASSIPVDDGIHHEAFAEAFATVSALLQEGKSKSACVDLADSMIKSVKDAVDTSQKIMNGLDNGATCKDEGQEAVKKAIKARKDADDKAKQTAKQVTAACDADVNFAKKSLSSLDKKSCSVFFNDPAYKTAKKKCEDAEKAHTKASGAAKQAKKAVADAKDVAAEEQRKCRCKVEAAHKKAVANANKANSKENAKAWTKAHHMKCVIAESSAKNCKVPDLPKVKAAKLAPGVAGANCAKSPSKKKSNQLKGCAKFDFDCKKHWKKHQKECCKCMSMDEIKKYVWKNGGDC